MPTVRSLALVLTLMASYVTMAALLSLLKLHALLFYPDVQKHTHVLPHVQRSTKSAVHRIDLQGAFDGSNSRLVSRVLGQK